MSNLATEANGKSNKPLKALDRDGQYSSRSTDEEGGRSIAQFTHDLGERAGEMASKVNSSITDYYATSQKYVRENPAKGVAIAAAAGIVAGFLLTASRRKRSD